MSCQNGGGGKGGGKGDPELRLGSVKLEQLDFQVEKLRRHFGVQGRVHLGFINGKERCMIKNKGTKTLQDRSQMPPDFRISSSVQERRGKR